MRSSIPKYLSILHDHDLSPHGVGARHRKRPTSEGGGGYLDNCTRLELSLSASELDAAVQTVELPTHWRKISDYLGSELFLVMWRRLETLRTERRLRMVVPKFDESIELMEPEQFEYWLDAQRLPAAWFEIYRTVSSEQYRTIWKTLYQSAYWPGRREIRIYVPVFSVWSTHLKYALIYSLLHAGVPKQKVSHHLIPWTQSTISISRLNAFENRLKQAADSLPLPR